MKKTRMIAILTVLLLVISLFALPAFATEGGETQPTTETQATQAPAPIKLSNFYMVGSNGKHYLCDPTLADNVDKYTFRIPNWMEETTVVVKAAAGLKMEGSGVSFTEKSGVYEAKLTEIVKAEQSYSFTVTDPATSKTRTISINLLRQKIDCKIESVTMYKGDNAVTPSGSVADGLTFTLPSGTTSGVSFTIMPRHENVVRMTRLTGLADGETPGAERTQTLELNKSTRYSYTPTLEEGTNTFRLEVEAGDVKKNCSISVIVGDANANAPTTTTEATVPTAVASVTDAPTTIATLPTNPLPEEKDGFKMSPLLWVFLGVIITVVIGAIIFLIANSVGKNRDYDDYDDYDDYGDGGDYYDDQPRRPAPRGGRDLTDYIDDDYDDGYGSGGSYSGRSRSSYRDDGYDDGYSRGGSRRGGRGYDDYDDGYGGRGGYR